MRRKNQDFQLEEIPGDQYPTLEDAQRAALRAPACDLAGITKSLLASGRLVQRGNQIIVNPKR